MTALPYARWLKISGGPYLAVAKQNPQVGRETIIRFDERIKTTAALMPQQADAFLRVVDEECDILFNEYGRNSEALKQRLGLAPPFAAPPSLVMYHRQTLGEMAARAAI